MSPPLTLDGYIRVSRVAGREGDSFISPDVQRDQIATWARLRGVTIAEWHTDLDVSGGTMVRPGLNTLLERVRQGHTGGVAVARLDRLSRASVADALNVIAEIHDAGGKIAAVDLGIDPTTAFGEFATTIMLALARMERRRIAEQWRVSRQRAVERGVHVSSARPTGYLKGPDGRLVPHPEEADVVRELFRRTAAGDSWTEIARFLNDTGISGPYGPEQWTGSTVSKLVGKRVYLGEARSGEFVNHDAHEPLVDRSLWEAAQTPRAPMPPRGEPALLAGLLRCAGCRHLMKPDTVRVAAGRARTYRCRGDHSTGSCEDRAAVMGHLVEGHVERVVLEHFGAKIAVGEAGDDDELRDAEQAAVEADRALVTYRDDDRILAVLGTDRYVEGLQTRARAVDEAHALVVELRASRSPVGIDHEQLVEIWPGMEVVERKKVLAAALDCVFIRSGRFLPVEQRVAVFWRGEAPGDLPRRGRRVPLRPLVWPDDPPAKLRVATAHDLGERRIEG